MKGAEAEDLILNPGVEHILKEDDTVYYIAFASEKNTKLKGVAKRHTLYHACANFAIIAMATCGINPFELQQKESDKEKGPDKVGSDSKPNSCDSSSIGTYTKSVDGKSADPSLAECDGTIPDIVTVDEDSHIPSPVHPPSSPARGSRESQQKHDALRGMQLLRFHSTTAPPVKVNVVQRESAFQWPSPIMSTRSSASNTPTPSIKSSQRQHNTPEYNRQKVLLGRPGRKNSYKAHIDVPPLILAGQEQDFTSPPTKYSSRGAPNLSNLVEDPMHEGSYGTEVNGRSAIEPCHISITLEEEPEEPVGEVRRKGSVPILHKAPWIRRQFSVPTVTITGDLGLKKRSKNSIPSSNRLAPAGSNPLTRWASDSKLKKPDSSPRLPHLHLTQELESDGLRIREDTIREEGIDINLCLSDQNLLTPTSVKRHELRSQVSEPHHLFPRRSSLFKGIHRRRSSHGLDNNVHEIKVSRV